MKTPTLLPVVVLFFSLTLFSCAKKNQSITSQQLDITEPFEITYSEGGGFTGLVESYNVKSTGEVLCFQKMPGKSDSLLWSKNVPIQDLAELQRSLTMSGILNDSLDTVGNMTSKLTYTTPDTTRTMSWEGAGAVSTVSPEFKKWLAQFKSILKNN